VKVAGAGTVELAAYGIADAEHRVEKEIRRLIPSASVAIASVERPTDSSRIVEEFSVTYRLRLTVSIDARDDAAAASAAFRSVRESLAGTRYDRTRWEIGR